MTNNDERALNGYEISNQLRHLADNEIDSDSFAVVTENHNGSEVEFERPITDLALDAAGLIDALLAERDADKKVIADSVVLFETLRQRIAELEARTVSVKLPKPHAHLIWIQAGHGPDDYWDDVAVSHSLKDRCCDGSERYPVYSIFEIQDACAAAGIKLEVGE